MKELLNQDIEAAARWGYSKLDIVQDGKMTTTSLKMAIKEIFRS